MSGVAPKITAVSTVVEVQMFYVRFSPEEQRRILMLKP